MVNSERILAAIIKDERNVLHNEEMNHLLIKFLHAPLTPPPFSLA